MDLSEKERKILNYIQKDLPLVSQPFKFISKKIGIEEGEFINTIKAFRKKGIIRNFKAGINHKKLGFKSTLIALRVAEDKIKLVTKKIIIYPEVTHCFLREGEFNVWLVYICPDGKELNQFLNKLADMVGKENVKNIPTKRKFKLDTRLKI